jgi:uncharacterized protein (DUF2252 family)
MKNAAKASAAPLSESARLQRGRAQIQRLPHKQFGEYAPARKRNNPLVTLRKAEKDRVPELLPVKYGRMRPNAFAFYRGSVGIMASDLAAQANTKLLVQLCGDAHLQNLGCFESPDGRVVFDINDFDEAALGPWEWDVKRMATSIVLAGALCHHDPAGCEEAALNFAHSYCQTITNLASQPTLVAARHIIHRLGKSEAISAAFEQAERAKPADLLKKYATNAKGHYKFKKVAGEWPASKKEAQAVLRSLDDYRKTLPPERLHFFDFYRPVDVAFKIVGTGSVGLRDYVVLMQGRDPDDALFLQVKQEVLSTYAPFLKIGRFKNQGQRVVEGQHRIQPVSDLLLGWTTIGKYDFLVRQLNDHKGSLDIENMRGKGLASLAGVAGELLARGHARSGDALAITGYLGADEKVQKSIVRFARSYARQVNEDFAAFQEAVKVGTIKAGTIQAQNS